MTKCEKFLTVLCVLKQVKSLTEVHKLKIVYWPFIKILPAELSSPLNFMLKYILMMHELIGLKV